MKHIFKNACCFFSCSMSSRKSTLAIMFSTPPRSQIPKTSTPDTPKPTHRHPTTSTPESSDNYTSDDSPKISKREIRPPPIKSIPKLAISSDEDKEKGPGVKGEGYDNVSSLLCKIGGKKKLVTKKIEAHTCLYLFS